MQKFLTQVLIWYEFVEQSKDIENSSLQIKKESEKSLTWF